MNYVLLPAARADLVAGYEWIYADNPDAADNFLDTARETMERLAQFPESGAAARFKSKKCAGVRFSVLNPPYQKWILFYRRQPGTIEVGRVIYGTMNWRKSPARFF